MILFVVIGVVYGLIGMGVCIWWDPTDWDSSLVTICVFLWPIVLIMYCVLLLKERIKDDV